MRKILAFGVLRVAVAVLLSMLSGLQLSAKPRETTIGPPYVPGVPDWVYTRRVSPDVRSLFILQYGMLYQAELYQKSIYPASAAENFKVLVNELVDVFGSFASKDVNGKDIPTDLPDSDQGLLQINAPTLIQRLHDRIRQEVFKNDLQDIANSPDLVPSLVPARPTMIGPRPVKRPKLLTHEEVVKLLQNPVTGATTKQAVDSLDPTGLDSQLVALKDAMVKANEETQRQEHIVQACYRGCDQLPSGEELACMNACHVPFQNSSDAFDRTTKALYAFERINNCGLTHCSGPK